MKARWLLNLVLLIIVAGLAAFVYLRPAPVEKAQPASFTVSNLDVNSFKRLSIEKPGKKPVVFEKQNGRWRMVDPIQGRADIAQVGRVLSVAVATARNKFPGNDLARFGLNSPGLKVHIDDQEFSFGMFEPVSGDQYVAYKDAVYMLPTLYSEGANTQPLEFLDKHPLDPNEEIAGFNFAGLEQWEKTRLSLELDNGIWKVSPSKAKPNQAELKDWFSSNWTRLEAKSVELYTPNREQHPWFSIKLKNGKTLRFLKIQESPELLLVREDEKLLYHFPQDTGFTILNPPVGYRED